ncbi:MAG: ATP-grasp domain-containing protein, partial [Acidobacteriota bacterium]
MTTKNIMMVGGATVPALCRAASRRGLNIIAVCFPEAYERGAPDPSTIHVEPVDFSRVIPTVRRLLELHKQLGFEGIVAVSEYGQLAAAMVARELGMPGTPLHAVQNTRDKARMRRTLAGKGLGQVRFRACADVGQAHEFLASLDGSMIVKPVMGTGSDGVSRVTDASQLAASWELAGGARSFGGVICEEYIDGPEVSIEAYLSGGQFVPVAITDKMIDERFLETGHSQPSLLPAAMQETIFNATHAILSALDITDAVTHTE